MDGAALGERRRREDRLGRAETYVMRCAGPVLDHAARNLELPKPGREIRLATTVQFHRRAAVGAGMLGNGGTRYADQRMRETILGAGAVGAIVACTACYPALLRRAGHAEQGRGLCRGCGGEGVGPGGRIGLEVRLGAG